MNAFEALGIEEAGAVAEKHPAVAGEARHSEPTSVRQALCAVANHLTAIQNAADEGMELEALKGVVRVGTRILVVESSDVAYGDFSVGDAVDPGAAVFVSGERIAEGIDDFAFGNATSGDFPQLL